MSDHKAEAERLSAPNQVSLGLPGYQTPEQKLAAAQVHATLYAAEQQKRIADEAHTANLFQSLDLLFPDEVGTDTPWGPGGIDTEKREARNRATVALIREGLGL